MIIKFIAKALDRVNLLALGSILASLFIVLGTWVLVSKIKKNPVVVGYTVYMPELATTTMCKRLEKNNCGVSAYDCEEGVDYLCQHSVIPMKVLK